MDTGEALVVTVLTAVLVGAFAFMAGIEVGVSLEESLTAQACAEGQSLVYDQIVYECTPVYNTETREAISG